FQAEDGIRDRNVTGVQTCALPIWGWDRTPLRMLALGLIGQITIFGIGVPWLAIAAGYGPAEAIAAGFTPFLVGGAIKSLIAAAVLPLAWRVVHGRRR